MARINVNQYLALGVLAPVPFNLALVSGFNQSGTLRYFQLFARNTVPILGAAPVQSIIVPGQSNFSFTPSAQQAAYSPGLAWGVSSTPNTFTAAAELFWVHCEGNSQ